MRMQKIYCDYCKEEIPIVKKRDFFGIEREFYRMGKIDYGCEGMNKVDPNKLGVDLCERCAGLISTELLKTRINLIEAISKSQ